MEQQHNLIRTETIGLATDGTPVLVGVCSCGFRTLGYTTLAGIAKGEEQHERRMNTWPCPVCRGRMRSNGAVLVCPDCGEEV